MSSRSSFVRDVDVVVAENRLILLEAQIPQPAEDIHGASLFFLGPARDEGRSLGRQSRLCLRWSSTVGFFQPRRQQNLTSDGAVCVAKLD